MFPVDKLAVIPMLDRSQVIRSCRYWDKAGTAGGDGSYTAGVLMHMLKDKRLVIEHVVRGRWSALERENEIKAWARQDKAKGRTGSYSVVVEQEPGSGGKESAEATIRNLAGFSVFADRVTGEKEIRAEPFAAQVQGGNVWLCAGPWHRDLLDEMESFPNGKYKDQVDACSGAFARLARLGRRQAAGCETCRDTPRRARRPEAPLALRPVPGSGAALSPHYWWRHAAWHP
jgi:predicted phage terminase large subunit-like protein